MRADPILDVDQIYFYYNSRSEDETIFRDLSFSLHHSESLALLGQSGIGKTTLCRLLSGLLLPTSGRVLFNGSPVAGPSSAITISFQNYPFFPWLSVEDNVLFGVKRNRKDKESVNYAYWLLSRVGLDLVRHRYPRDLSGGMQQRLSIARALAVHPEVLILDEPFSALDAGTKADLMELILDLQEKTKFAFIAVLHNLEDAYFLAKRSIVLKGRPAQICLDIDIKNCDFTEYKNIVIEAIKEPKQDLSMKSQNNLRDRCHDLGWMKVDA